MTLRFTNGRLDALAALGFDVRAAMRGADWSAWLGDALSSTAGLAAFLSCGSGRDHAEVLTSVADATPAESTENVSAVCAALNAAFTLPQPPGPSSPSAGDGAE